MNNFNLGDVCIIVDDPNITRREYIGTECVIVDWLDGDEKNNCRICMHTGETLRGHTRVLRKKPPPRQPTVPWSECLWQPDDLRVF